MKINEIIDSSVDLFDILNDPMLIELDKFHGSMARLSQNFSLPPAAFNAELVRESEEDFQKLYQKIGHKNIALKWKNQLNQVKVWFDEE